MFVDQAVLWTHLLVEWLWVLWLSAQIYEWYCRQQTLDK